MSSLKRKLSRKKANKEKKNAEKEMAIKIALFGKLPNNCLTCEEPFDKMNKEQVTTWNVVVNQQKNVVRLYCPSCWDKAVNIIQDFKKHLEDKNKK